jgi:DNA-binding MarR family transcriptional regulator/energy-coupling factor transporter ATP-binding protein EcfA2
MNITDFERVVDSLKLYRRAELLDENGKQLINKLYVDQLPNDQILKTVIKPNTTYIIGRKGSGKSTLFQKAHSELNKNKKVTWAYLDIKTIFESSTSDISIPDYLSKENTLTIKTLKKILVFRSFIIELVSEIKKQIDKRIYGSFWESLKDVFSGTREELIIKLDEFISDIDDDHFLNITSIKQNASSETRKTSKTENISAEVSGNFSNTGMGISLKIINEIAKAIENSKTNNYSEVYLRVFNIRDLVNKLKDILSSIGLNHLYIFLDDFSELSKNDIEEIVDTILCPFNNWSDDFIKLKIALYPGRLYFGQIDRTKVDEIYLDIYRAFGRSDVNDMEDSAIDFTKRLITTRLNEFCAGAINVFFDIKNPDLWRVLFYSCMGNPRSLGYILYYCFETMTINSKAINISSIQDASRRYFEEKILYAFKLNKFLHESYEEKSSIYSLKELFEQLARRAKELKSYKDSKVLGELEGKAPTSHFHIVSQYDSVLNTLELNFFITKYYEMKDRDGRDVSVYALHYGLCQQQSINFGKPKEKREHRLYFIERIFDFTPIVISYLKLNQEIICDSCGERHSTDMLPAIITYNMLCPKCRIGKCQIINLSKKYGNLIESINPELLLPQTDIGILKSLSDQRKEMFAKDIAEELDCSYQLIGKRGKYLEERQLLDRKENKEGRRTFKITQKANSIYFTGVEEDNLQI